jgi:hypothetical protein
MLLASFGTGLAAEGKHDLFNLSPGMEASLAVRILDGAHGLKVKCEPRMNLDYDHTSKDKCFSDYADMTALEVIYAAALPDSPVISVSVYFNRDPAAILQDASQQFGNKYNVEPVASGGRMYVWNLGDGSSLTLIGSNLILESDKIRSQNKEAWSPTNTKQAPKF